MSAVGVYGPTLVFSGNVPSPIVLASTPVTVKNVDGSPATCYTDRTGATTTSNVTATDSQGNLTFYAAPGPYLIEYTNRVGAQSLEVEVPPTASTDSATYARADLPVTLTGGAAHNWNAAHSAYNFKASNTRFLRAGLASAVAAYGGTASCRINCIGDSITAGSQAVGALYRASWPARLADFFAGAYGYTGTGVVHLIDNSYASDDRLTVSGGGWNLSTFGAFGHGGLYATGATNTITFTPDGPCDGFNVYYVKGTTAGTFTVAVDGGTPVNVNSNNASEAAGVYTVTGLTPGQHSIVVTAPATNSVYLTGFESTLGSTGVRVSRMARGGSLASEALASGGATTVTSPYVLFTQTPGDCTLLMFGANEAQTGVPVATFKANMQSLITDGLANGDVILLVPPSDAATTPALSSYRLALYELADSNDLPLIDLYDLFGASATAQARGLLYIDAIHPTDKGYKAIAHTVYAALQSLAARPTEPSATYTYSLASANQTITTTSYVTLPWGAGGATVNIKVKARAGDVLTISPNFVSGADAVDTIFDALVVASGNYVSSGSNTAATYGVAGWYGPSGVIATVGPSFSYAVQSADVDTDGTVTLRPVGRNLAAGTKNIYNANRNATFTVQRTTAGH